MASDGEGSGRSRRLHADAPVGGLGRRGIRAALGVPLVVASMIAVTLGISPRAEATTPSAKRHVKPKARGSSAAHETIRVGTVGAAPAEYIVSEGDTVTGIAEHFGLATAGVLAANGLGWSSQIFLGQRLALPGGTHAEPVPPRRVASEIARHIVAEGDTIGGIAADHGLDVASVLSANGLGPSSLIFPGEAVVLPPADPQAAVDTSRSELG